MAKITDIRGTITLDNGETVEFQFDDANMSRWGNTVQNLGETVDATEAMQKAVFFDD